ncbi:MAG TPA: hypothetical protein VIY86_03370, partial [Pirellulaceae bacterium]
ARRALENALREFDGTVLLVSHDRYFLDRAVNRLLVFDEGRLQVFPGNYSEYVAFRDSTRSASKPPSTAGSLTGMDRSTSRSQESATPKRKRKFAYRKVADLEDEIARRETSITEIHQRLSEPDVLRNGEWIRQLKAELAVHQEALTQLYEHWEEAAELN